MSFFQNKVVWITGASSGIGEALAYAFAKEKTKLILSARRANELKRVKKNTGLPDSDVFLLPLDVSEYSQTELHAQKAIAHFGSIDILINNAGISHWTKAKDLSLDVIKRIMDVNFMGNIALTQAVLPAMREKRKGHIVVVSSVLGKIITPKQAAYSASKFALHGFYDTLRAETQAEGIKVLIVCPGFVKTNVAKNSLNRDGVAINKESNAIANGLDPLYVANTILNAIRKNKEEIVIAGWKEKMAVLIRRLFPALFSALISKNKIA